MLLVIYIFERRGIFVVANEKSEGGELRGEDWRKSLRVSSAGPGPRSDSRAARWVRGRQGIGREDKGATEERPRTRKGKAYSICRVR